VTECHRYVANHLGFIRTAHQRHPAELEHVVPDTMQSFLKPDGREDVFYKNGVPIHKSKSSVSTMMTDVAMVGGFTSSVQLLFT
jgi:hypothetical protein